MITHDELKEWRANIRFQKEQAMKAAARHSDCDTLYKYYNSQACIADAQEALIERLVRQSRENEGAAK